ncbi:MAG: argininosuccinate lyase [Halarsenatibacteraceae bacterium]
MRLWGENFNSDSNNKLNSFNSSLPFDIKLYKYDLTGSRAHVKMLAAQNIITKEDKNKILHGLKIVENKIDKAIASGDYLDYDAEDIHSLIEELLTEEIGPVAGKIHTGRSRNDQVALDIKLYLKDQINKIQDLLKTAIISLAEIAENETETLMPGYTHLQAAQPITLGHHLLAYAWKLKRDYDKLSDTYTRHNLSPLGAGALAGSSFPLDRELVAEELDFAGITENSLDTVSDRDFILDFHSSAVNIILHLSSFAEEIIIWNSPNYNFIEISDEMATGSSIMPQKKNPDVAELIRGKSGRILGNHTALATSLKGLPLAYNKDLQEDKEGLFDTVDNLIEILNILPDFLKSISFNRDKLEQATYSGYLNATELADYLAAKGLPFRLAHQVSGKTVNYAIENNCQLSELEIKKFQEILVQVTNSSQAKLPEVIIDQEIYNWLDLNNAVRRKNIPGGPAPEQVEKQIIALKNYLSN